LLCYLITLSAGRRVLLALPLRLTWKFMTTTNTVLVILLVVVVVRGSCGLVVLRCLWMTTSGLEDCQAVAAECASSFFLFLFSAELMLFG